MLANFVSTISIWVVLSLAVASVAITLGANWLVVRLNPDFKQARPTAGGVVASLIWMLLVLVAGLIVTRYLERWGHAVVGYLLFGLFGVLLSLGRAYLHGRAQMADKPGWSQPSGRWSAPVLTSLSYLLTATLVYFCLSLLFDQRVQPVLFLPLYIGALLPELDSQGTLLGRLLPFLSRPMEARLGPVQAWHTPLAALLVGLVTAPLILWIGARAWYLIPLGFLSHLLLDLLEPKGIMLLWPVRQTRYRIWGGRLRSAQGLTGGRLVLLLAVLAVLLLLVVDIGPEPPPPARRLSYQESLERYQAVRGSNLIFADVEGAWQATGRRVSDRFEILNARGESFILLDRYTGRVFTAGRSAEDDLYASRLGVVTGAPAQIKAVEAHLEDQLLADALPLLYQMEQEPGLEHIFVSGQVVLPDAEEGALEPDYTQTSLRKVQVEAPGHYSLHYLTAAELIELAAVPVARADLVIVATYLQVPAGPTPTPLPTASVGEGP